LEFLKVTPEKAEFQFVSYSIRTLTLRKNSDGNYGVFTEVDGGTFWFPKITRVEIHAKKAEAGDLVVELFLKK
jgi:hypothetical protein